MSDVWKRYQKSKTKKYKHSQTKLAERVENPQNTRKIGKNVFFKNSILFVFSSKFGR